MLFPFLTSAPLYLRSHSESYTCSRNRPGAGYKGTASDFGSVLKFSPVCLSSLLYSYKCCYILKTPVRLLLSVDVQYSSLCLCSCCPSALFPRSLNLSGHLLLRGPAWMSSSQQQSSSLFLMQGYEPSPHASYLSLLHFLGSSSISCSCDYLSHRGTLQGQGSSLSPTLPLGLVELQTQRGAQKCQLNKIELVIIDVVHERCKLYCLWCKHNSVKV